MCILVLGLPCGCRKEKDIGQLIAENSCKAILNDSRCGENAKQLAKKVLEGWADDVVDPHPVLLHAGYLQDDRYDHIALILTISDEDFDVAGFLIREVWKEKESEQVMIEEEYPIFPELGVGDCRIVWFDERNDVSESKDEQAWSDYVNDPNRVLIFRRQRYPRILISLADPAVVRVDVRIYDFAGNKSEWVPLEEGAPGARPKKKAERADL
ncbi:MAG TPA: hypothetical protein VMX13_16990 [Sedimentisphaerales bacterium]|nr:hypothetical protein [Sedimentisphaerales bacterium]